MWSREPCVGLHTTLLVNSEGLCERRRHLNRSLLIFFFLSSELTILHHLRLTTTLHFIVSKSTTTFEVNHKREVVNMATVDAATVKNPIAHLDAGEDSVGPISGVEDHGGESSKSIKIELKDENKSEEVSDDKVRGPLLRTIHHW